MMTAYGSGYSQGYSDVPDYPEEGPNTVDEQAANIWKSLRNRFVEGPGGVGRPDMGQYNAPAQPELSIPINMAPAQPPPSAMTGSFSDNAVMPWMRGPQRAGQELPSPLSGNAEPSGGKVRAIRMPDGKFLFTNDDSYGGNQYDSTADAGRDIRNAQRNDPAFAVMNGLVQASMRATQGESRAPAATTQVPGNTNITPGGLSTMQPGGLDTNALGAAAGAAAMARYEHERQYQQQLDKLTPEQIAELQDRNLHEKRWVIGSWQRSSDENNRARDAEVVDAKSKIPPGPALDKKLGEIEDKRQSEEDRFLHMFGGRGFTQADVNARDSYNQPVQPIPTR